jgi:hypothetical protein
MVLTSPKFFYRFLKKKIEPCRGEKFVQGDKQKSSQVPDMFPKEFPTALHLRPKSTKGN